MITQKIDKLIRLTAYELDLPDDVVEEVIKHQFKELRKFLEKPDKPRIQLPYLGSWTIKEKSLRHYISQSAKRLKDKELLALDPSIEGRYKETIRLLWSLKEDVHNYHKSRKIPHNARQLWKTKESNGDGLDADSSLREDPMVEPDL